MIGGKRVGEQGLFRAADGADRRQARHESRTGGDLRAGGHGDAVQAIRPRFAPAANDTIYGLAAGIWTKDISKAPSDGRAAASAGTVWINCYNVFDAALPFGGYKQSGWGREMGHEVLELYTETKSVCVAL